jgi:CheY-like chemotaxis protein
MPDTLAGPPSVGGAWLAAPASRLEPTSGEGRAENLLDRSARPVLVVEDHEDTREMVQTFLEFDGYTVCAAKHGLEALECVEKERPCLILLDLSMPIMDGVAFARELRRHPDTEIASTPVLLLTALPNPAAAMRETGALEVLSKPIDFDRLMVAVERHRRRPRR